MSLKSRLEDIAGSLSHIAAAADQNKVLLEQNAVLATRANELIEANTALTEEVRAAVALESVPARAAPVKRLATKPERSTGKAAGT